MLELVTLNHDLRQQLTATLDEIARAGAKRLLLEALDREVADYIAKHKDQRDENGHALVTRNGKANERSITVGSGTLKVQAPRVYDRREGKSFTSNILPKYARKSANVESLLPILYLKGLSSNDFQSALTCLLGEGASGLSASSITALKRSWESEFSEWRKREIKGRYVYMWADGVNVKVRLGEDKKLCLLVIVGVREDGRKELLAVEPGYRESEDSWSFVLRSLKDRGLKVPRLAIGDGALGFWNALRNVFPSCQEQRCWVHKIANVLNDLPKRLHSNAKALLHEMMYANTAADAHEALSKFEVAFGLKNPKATECLKKDWNELMTFFRFPASHWGHLRTTNPIESTFATVKLRTKITKGAGSATAAATMAFKLMQEAEKRWLRIRGAEEIKNVISCVEYRDGVVVTELSHREAVS